MKPRRHPVPALLAELPAHDTRGNLDAGAAVRCVAAHYQHNSHGSGIMACFLVPGAEAIVVSAVAHHLKKKESAREGALQSAQRVSEAEGVSASENNHSSSSLSIPAILTSKAAQVALLANLLWGGVALLAFEHLWHGELSVAPPFLTALGTNAQASMFQEMGTVGVGMALAVTAIWAIAIAAIRAHSQKSTTAVSLSRTGDGDKVAA